MSVGRDAGPENTDFEFIDQHQICSSRSGDDTEELPKSA